MGILTKAGIAGGAIFTTIAGSVLTCLFILVALIGALLRSATVAIDTDKINVTPVGGTTL